MPLGLKPVIHLGAIHVAYLGKNDGMHGLKGLDHRAGGGNASQRGQIAGENDSGRLFQFGDFPDTADATVDVAEHDPELSGIGLISGVRGVGKTREARRRRAAARNVRS